MIAMGGRLFAPTSFEMSEGPKDTPARSLPFPPEGASSCLNTSLAIDLSSLVSEGFAERAVEVAASLLLPAGSRPDSSAPESSMHASSPLKAFAFPGMSLSEISGPVSACFGSPSAIASSASAPPLEAVGVPFGCSSGAGQNVDAAVKVDSDSDGFSPALDFSKVRSDSFDVSSLGAAVLGKRFRFSLPVMSKCGVPSTRSSPNRC